MSSAQATSYVLLGLLTSGPQHGYDLKQAHDGALPRAKPLAFGQVYATLGRLERDGLVVKAGSDQAGGPERTSFAITDTGREALMNWLAEVEPAAPFVASTLLAKVVVALLTAGHEQARDYLIRQRETHSERMRELTRAKTDPATSLGDVIAADYALVHLDADLRWLETTMARVADLHLGVHS